MGDVFTLNDPNRSVEYTVRKGNGRELVISGERQNEAELILYDLVGGQKE